MGFINQFTTTFGETAPANAVRGAFHFKGDTKIEFTGNIEDTGASGSFEFIGASEFTFAGNVFNTKVRGSFAFDGETDFTISGRAIGAREIFFKGETKMVFAGRVGLPLVQPEPIINELSPGDFESEQYAAKLFLNNVQTKIRSFSYSQAKGTIGAALNVTLAKSDRNQLAGNPNVRFELWEKINGEWIETSYIDSAEINSKSYTLNVSGDSLSFSTQSLLSDKLSVSPRRNLICYSSSKLAVNIDDLEPVFVRGGGFVATQTRPFSILTLYNLLHVAFVEGCGFSSVQTNIPNFEVLRCDFEISSTYLEAVAGIFGVYEPLFFAVGDVLWILDKTQSLPAEFSPRPLRRAKINGVSMRSGNNQIVDGYEIQYLSSTANGTVSVREKSTVRQIPDAEGEFTETISVKYKEWKDSEGALLDSQLIYKQTERSRDLTFYIETIGHQHDGQGRKTFSSRTLQTRVPSPYLEFDTVLTEVREERSEYLYRNDPFNTRRIIPKEYTTQIAGLVVIDGENLYLGESFTQDIIDAHRAGNITTDMTAVFTPIKTRIKRFTPLGNGQVEREEFTIDHLRGNVPVSDDSDEPGDVSLNGELSKQRSIIVLRMGVTLANKKNPVPKLQIGEVPLIFGEQLADRKLARQFAELYEGPVEVAGFSKNLKIGVYFSLDSRAGDTEYFLTEGYTISGDNSGIRTTIDVAQIQAEE